MIISTAKSRSEAARTGYLLPSYIRDSGSRLINFVQEYYTHLNTNGLPSFELSSITSQRDLDEVSDKYIDLIGAEIAKTVPQSVKIDKLNLYKKIVSYYATRGTEDSVVVFFRIFFDEIVDVYYPKVNMFKPSDGVWDDENQRWQDTRSFSSSNMVLQDGEFYQDFSYQIKSAMPFQDWEYAYSRLVHPAGLKVFAQILLFVLVQTDFGSWRDTRRAGNAWEDTRVVGHSPTVQPGWIEDSLRRLRFFLFASSVITEEAIRRVYVDLLIVSTGNRSHLHLLHDNYEWLKNFDSTEASVYDSISPLADYSFDPNGRTFIRNYSNVGVLIEDAPYIPPPLDFRNTSGYARDIVLQSELVNDEFALDATGAVDLYYILTDFEDQELGEVSDPITQFDLVAIDMPGTILTDFEDQELGEVSDPITQFDLVAIDMPGTILTDFEDQELGAVTNPITSLNAQ